MATLLALLALAGLLYKGKQDEDVQDVPRGDLCSICETDVEQLSCDGTHRFCVECFDTYARSAFQGSFCREIQRADGAVSRVEELPCPFWEHNNCSCSNLSVVGIRSHLSEASFDLWRQAVGRIAIARADQERIEIEQRQEERRNYDGVFHHLLNAVQEALTLGGSVSCPNCNFPGEKDDACMHITCQNCQCSWCYCCGRSRDSGAANGCAGCDQRHIYIHDHPGWGNLQQESGETRGFGALHEFHRCRMAYFIRQLVESIPNAPWDAFWEEHGTVLEQVPTPSRRITLQEIQSAEPPVFAPSTTDTVAWRFDTAPIIERLGQTLAEHQELRPPEPPQRNETEEQIAKILQDETLDLELQQALLESVMDGPPPQPDEDLEPEENRAPRHFRLFRRRIGNR